MEWIPQDHLGSSLTALGYVIVHDIQVINVNVNVTGTSIT